MSQKTEDKPLTKNDLNKKEIYEYINNVYSKNMDLMNKIYTESVNRQEDVFTTLNIILYVFTVLILILGAVGLYRSRVDKKFLEDLISAKTERYQDELDDKSKKIKELEDKIIGFSDEIDLIRNAELLTRELQSNYKKMFEGSPEEIIDGITKITDKFYYNPLIHRKIEDLSDSKNDSVKIVSLKALSVFGDTNALKKLTRLARKNKEAETTLKNLKEEYPDLFKNKK
jgi:cell division septum initiation protein DivIVA